MSKKKSDIDEFADVFANLQKSNKEVEELLTAASEAEQQTEVKTEKAEEKTKEVIMSQAFGVHKDAETGKWCVAEIHYNPVTGEARLHNDAALTNLSKAITTVRANELLNRVSLGLSIKQVKGYK